MCASTVIPFSAKKNEISPVEQRRREKAVEFAYASSALEGGYPSQELRIRGQLFIAGKIDLAEFLGKEAAIAL